MITNLNWKWKDKIIPLQDLNEYQIEKVINFLKTTKKTHFQKVNKKKYLIQLNAILVKKEDEYLTNYLNKNRNQKIISAVDKFVATVFPKDFKILKH